MTDRKTKKAEQKKEREPETGRRADTHTKEINKRIVLLRLQSFLSCVMEERALPVTFSSSPT